MNKIKLISISIFIFWILPTNLFSQGMMNKSNISSSILGGYNRGFGTQATIGLNQISQGNSLGLRLGIGYSIIDPGNATEARKIFINDATNGVPEKKGTDFDFKFDFLISNSIFKIKDSYLFFGPRYSTFKGNFKYIGGNEDFDVKSKQWGLGIGEEIHIKMTKKLSLVIMAGVDYFFPRTLTGHDTSYSPDDDNINPRTDDRENNVLFTYEDADAAIKQPFFMPKFMIGLDFSFN
ncbi:MAG: hypothetical protein JXR51_09280 [Bacteroidales bacterium]|nr:hypothetical protein [Bacteroidales bacterium]MBN2757356.1 hypothetical protein [Bacteroidales bacterium]